MKKFLAWLRYRKPKFTVVFWNNGVRNHIGVTNKIPNETTMAQKNAITKAANWFVTVAEDKKIWAFHWGISHLTDEYGVLDLNGSIVISTHFDEQTMLSTIEECGYALKFPLDTSKDGKNNILMLDDRELVQFRYVNAGKRG